MKKVFYFLLFTLFLSSCTIDPDNITNKTLYITSIPKTTYYVGEKLDLSNLSLEIVKSDGSTVKVNNYKSIPDDGSILNKTGKNTITVIADDLSLEFNIMVYDVILNKLYIKSLPNKMHYYTGDTLDLTGIEIEAIFSDGHTEDVTNFILENQETQIFNTAGDNILEFSYLDKTIDLKIGVSKSLFEFIQQPTNLSYELYSENQELSATVFAEEDGYISFTWYAKQKNDTLFNQIYKTEPKKVSAGDICENSIIIPQNNYIENLYYCTSTLVKGITTKQITSNVASVEQTINSSLGISLLSIDTNNFEEPTCEPISSPVGVGAGITNATKVPGRISIITNDKLEYDSGNYEKGKSGMTVKIRGNTSAYTEKKPYKIKLQKKANLLNDGNDDNQDKEWNLLKDTTLNTVVGLKVSSLMGFNEAPEFRYVQVVMNNEYKGLYMLIECVGKGTDRINVDKSSGYIIERDLYWWNEDLYFQGDNDSNLISKYTFKYPDPEDITADQIAYIKNYITDLEASLKNGTFENYIDVNSFVNWLLTHDILGTWDAPGSNIYLKKYDSSTKLEMSCPWDFDTIYRQKDSWAKIQDEAIFYYPQLLKYSSFVDNYKSRWNEIKTSLPDDVINFVTDFVSTYSTGFDQGIKYDSIRYNVYNRPLDENRRMAISWFTSRKKWIDNNIDNL